jgi:hypothetical protein
MLSPVLTVQVDDPPTMNVLGLFLATALRRNLVERERPCDLRGGLAVDAGGMRATVRFEEGGVTVTRKEEPVRVTISAPLTLLVEAIVRPRLLVFLKVKVAGSRLFALKAMRLLQP